MPVRNLHNLFKDMSALFMFRYLTFIKDEDNVDTGLGKASFRKEWLKNQPQRVSCTA